MTRRQFIVAGVTITLPLRAALAAGKALSAEASDNLVLVKGGTFTNTNSSYYGKHCTVSSVYIGKYAVTQKEWIEVMGNNPSKFKGDNLPVEMVNWYDSVEYCNRRSIKESLQAYYNIDKNTKDAENKPDPEFGDLDKVKWTVTVNSGANGYRLPTEAEWEYAAGGGVLSKNYKYSGSDNIDDVAWYWRNSGDQKLSGFWFWPVVEQNHDQTRPVGNKRPNELGLYDMSGNVREWCWDWYGELKTNAADPTGSQSGFRRVWKGGGWMGAEYCCETAFRGNLAANGTGPDQGFRVARNV